MKKRTMVVTACDALNSGLTKKTRNDSASTVLTEPARGPHDIKCASLESAVSFTVIMGHLGD